MLFYFSKALAFLLLPSRLALLALLAGLVLSARPRLERLGRGLSLVGIAYIVIVGFLPVGTALLLPLEERFGAHMREPPTEAVRGIIMLGGFEEGTISNYRGGLAVNESAERLTEGLRLARKLPSALIVFSGGNGEMLGGEDASAAVGAFLADMGFGKERVVIEHQSRNTFENASYTRQLLKPEQGERWVLITSAFHMPRAVGLFRAAGFDVIPYPVDFRTCDHWDVLGFHDRYSDGLDRADLAIKEWVGLAVSWLSGKSSALFPGP